MTIIDNAEEFVAELCSKSSPFSEYCDFAGYFTRRKPNGEIEKEVLLTGESKFFNDPFNIPTIAVYMRFNHRYLNLNNEQVVASERHFIFHTEVDRLTPDLKEFIDILSALESKYEGLKFTIDNYTEEIINDNNCVEKEVSGLTTDKMINILKNSYAKGYNDIVFMTKYIVSNVDVKVSVHITSFLNTFIIVSDISSSDYPDEVLIREERTRFPLFTDDIDSEATRCCLDHINKIINKWISVKSKYLIDDCLEYRFRAYKNNKGEENGQL